MNFSSDNCAAVHPSVMDAMVKMNSGFAPSYGDDAMMDAVRQKIRDLFEKPDAAVFLVATGSAANSLAMASHVDPWQIIYCHEQAHLLTDECGAPEFFTGGARLQSLGGESGKFSAQTLQSAIDATPNGDVHANQSGAVSLTNATEAGTVYECAEISAISAVAKANGLPVHMDGARIANALVQLNCSPAELTWKSGIDVLSFGGTKNGLMGVEALVMFDPAKSWQFELRRKRAGHLMSKHRYLSVQMQAYLTENLWLENARTANARARQLNNGLAGISGVEICHPVQANMVFIRTSRAKHLRAMKAGAHYTLGVFDTPLDGDANEILTARLVSSWSTTQSEVDQLIDCLSD